MALDSPSYTFTTSSPDGKKLAVQSPADMSDSESSLSTSSVHSETTEDPPDERCTAAAHDLAEIHCGSQVFHHVISFLRREEEHTSPYKMYAKVFEIADYLLINSLCHLSVRAIEDFNQKVGRKIQVDFWPRPLPFEPAGAMPAPPSPRDSLLAEINRSSHRTLIHGIMIHDVYCVRFFQFWRFTQHILARDQAFMAELREVAPEVEAFSDASGRHEGIPTGALGENDQWRDCGHDILGSSESYAANLNVARQACYKCFGWKVADDFCGFELPTVSYWQLRVPEEGDDDDTKKPESSEDD
ncbi:hypothetical protein B0T14DRAFT_495739 [Immersiella caudata]|uniref:Uncharacterized protein n=1 Tax=Immersiella caudata TaxID=314043 RepID=A0AA40BZ53_9PEZI|nr:hypothetical protein B0T14DRAFT_495739 [Immersiella caudata]